MYDFKNVSVFFEWNLMEMHAANLTNFERKLTFL